MPDATAIERRYRRHTRSDIAVLDPDIAVLDPDIAVLDPGRKVGVVVILFCCGMWCQVCGM
jgi:hypothetical protein